MKQFKIVDFWINVGLIISFILISIAEGNENFLSNYFLTGYFVVGAWQVISMLVHAFRHCFTNKYGARYIYHWIVFVSIVTMPLGSFWILLFTAPFMAVFYTCICYRETYIKMKRPLTLLK
jgi:hypothetical protein